MRKKFRNFILAVIAVYLSIFISGLAYGTFQKQPHPMEKKRTAEIGQTIRTFNKSLTVSASEKIADIVFAQSKAYEIDPIMVFAIMSVESRFNTSARSHMGAQGLMQVMPRYHKTKIQGRDIRDPYVNTEVGIMIMKECKRSFPNSGTEQIFKCYLGKRDKLYNGKIKSNYTKFKTQLIAFELNNELPISDYSFNKPMQYFTWPEVSQEQFVAQL